MIQILMYIADEEDGDDESEAVDALAFGVIDLLERLLRKKPCRQQLESSLDSVVSSLVSFMHMSTEQVIFHPCSYSCV
jgi:hypothetical protein